MYIEEIKIDSFGNLSNFDLNFREGINIIEGENESGKSTVCAFIEFIFYGFANKSEKEHRLSWDCGAASGSLVLLQGGNRYRVDRTAGKKGGRGDEIFIVDMQTGTLCFEGQQPCDVFIGVPYDVFVKTAFVAQADGGSFETRSLGESLENIMFSADESVNTKKVLKKLDDMRITLLYKNKKGGRIYDLEQEKSELALRFDRAVSVNSELLIKEAALLDARKKYEENTKKREELSLRLERYETARIVGMFDKEDELEKKLMDLHKADNAREESYSHNGFLPNGEYIAKVRVVKTRLDEIEKEIAEADEKMARLQGDMQTAEEKSREFAGAEELIAEAGGRIGVLQKFASTSSRRKMVLFSGLLMAVIGAVLAVFFAGIIRIAATSFAVLGVAMAVCGFSRGLFEGRYLKKYGAENEEQLEKILASAVNSREKKEKIEEEIAEFVNTVAAKSGERREISARLADMVKKWGKNGFSELESAYNEMTAESAACEAERIRTRDMLAMLSGNLAGYSEGVEREKLAAFGGAPEGEENITELKREYDFLTKACQSLTEKIHLLDKELVSLSVTAEHPTKIYGAIKEREAEIAELRSRHDALVLAYSKLEEASESLRDSIAPFLSSSAGEFMDTLTDGRYSRVGVSKNLELEYEAPVGGGVRNRAVDFMSMGTRDLVYISLRLALMKLVFRESEPPAVFDESFARLDDTRLSHALNLLANTAEDGRQIFIFTSKKREGELLAGRANFIKMPNFNQQ